MKFLGVCIQDIAGFWGRGRTGRGCGCFGLIGCWGGWVCCGWCGVEGIGVGVSFCGEGEGFAVTGADDVALEVGAEEGDFGIPETA